MTPSPKTPEKTATNIAIQALGALLGFIHVFIGLVALIPLINRDYHREIEITYYAFAKELLGFYNFEVDYITVGEYFRLIVSAYQIALGVGQLENGHFSGSYDNVANYGLFALDSVILAFQNKVGTSYVRLALTIVCLILLGGRAILIGQSKKKKRVSRRSKVHLLAGTADPIATPDHVHGTV